MIATGLRYEIAALDTHVAGAEDFVIESWTRDYRCSPVGRAMRRDAYYPWQRGIIEGLRSAGAIVLVARDVEHSVLFYGWLCADRARDAVRLHYAYVKLFARGHGIFPALLAEAVEQLGDGAAEVVYTHDPAKRHKQQTNSAPRAKFADLGMTYQPIEIQRGRAA